MLRNDSIIDDDDPIRRGDKRNPPERGITLDRMFYIQGELNEKKKKGTLSLSEEADYNIELDELEKQFEKEEFEKAFAEIPENLNKKTNLTLSTKKAKVLMEKLMNKLSVEEFYDDIILKDLTHEEKELYIGEVGKQMRKYLLSNMYELIIKVFPNFPGLHSLKQLVDAQMKLKDEAEKKIKDLKINNDLRIIKSDLSRNNRMLELLYEKFIQDTPPETVPEMGGDAEFAPATEFAPAADTPQRSKPQEEGEVHDAAWALRMRAEVEAHKRKPGGNETGGEPTGGGGKKRRKKTKRRTKGRYKKKKSKKYRKKK